MKAVTDAQVREMAQKIYDHNHGEKGHISAVAHVKDNKLYLIDDPNVDTAPYTRLSWYYPDEELDFLYSSLCSDLKENGYEITQ